MHCKMASTSLGKDRLTKLNITTALDIFDIISAIKLPLPIPLQDLLNVYSDLKSDWVTASQIQPNCSLLIASFVSLTISLSL